MMHFISDEIGSAAHGARDAWGNSLAPSSALISGRV